MTTPYLLQIENKAQQGYCGKDWVVDGSAVSPLGEQETRALTCSIQAVPFLSSEQYFGAKLQGSPEAGLEHLCGTVECQTLQSLAR